MQLTRDEAVSIACGWHSVMTWNDPGVWMYSLSSTGKVIDEKHRSKIISYIDEHCLPHAKTLDDKNDPPILESFETNEEELLALREWVEQAKFPMH